MLCSPVCQDLPIVVTTGLPDMVEDMVAEIHIAEFLIDISTLEDFSPGDFWTG